MNTNDTVSTYQLVTLIAVEVRFLCQMLGAEQRLLEGRNEGGHVSSQRVQVDDFVGGEIVPLLVGLLATLAHEPTSAAEASCLTFLTLIAHWLVAGAHFLEGVLDVKEVVDVEGSLEPRDSTCWQCCVLATVWARKALSLWSPMYQRLEALLTKHVETLEQLWLCVGLQTYPTCDLVLDLLESFLSSSGGFGSHGSASSAASAVHTQGDWLYTVCHTLLMIFIAFQLYTTFSLLS